MKKILASLFIGLFLFASLSRPQPVHANIMGTIITWIPVIFVGCSQGPDYISPEEAVMCGEDGQINLVPWLVGFPSEQPLSKQQVKTGMISKSVVGSLYSGMGSMIKNRPAGVDIYIADLEHSINPAQPAYAQGIGFGSLTPVLGIWKAFRNLAYFFFVIIFMVLGLAIMFRAKLNPQTVVNIENILPKLIVTLVLITFSYAIVGFLIDIMYLLIYLLIGLASNSIFVNPPFNIKTIALDQSVIVNSFGLFFHGGGARAAESIGNVIGDLFQLQPGGFNDTINKGLKFIFGGGAAVVFYAVFAIAVVVQAFRTFFALLGSYIQIILHTVFAPMEILFNAFPGSNAFTGWLKNIVANLMVFPAIIGMILLALALLGQGTPDDIGYKNNPNIEQFGFTPPQLGLHNAGAVQGLIAIGIILAMPQVATLVKGAFGIQEGGKGGGGFMGGFLGGAIGAGLAPGLGLINKATGLYKTSVLTGALEGAQNADTRWGAVRGAIRGGAGAAVNPVGFQLGRQSELGKQRRAQSNYYEEMTKFARKSVTTPTPTDEPPAPSATGQTPNNTQGQTSSSTGKVNRQT